MPEQYQESIKGTTTIGLVFSDGVILSTEKRAIMGFMIASKKAKKVYQVADRIGMTTAGGVGDAQQLARILTVECSLYQIRRSRPITVGASATLLSNYLNQNRVFPYYVQLLVGGVDEHGPSVYSVDALGGSTKEEEIVATGSGSPMAYGVLEDRFKSQMTEQEAIDLSIRALKAAMKRDAGSGEGVHVVVITKDKYQELSEDMLKKYLANNHA